MDRARTNQVKISPTFRVVIPENVRKTLGLKAGQRLHVLPYRGRIALVPVRETREMRGFQRGMDTRFEREPEHEV
jgi:AbrB family looped-hinge helix DNA binding protein